MKVCTALIASAFASAALAWGLDVERPNTQHPDTRDIFHSQPGGDDTEAGPTFVAVPNTFTLEQVQSVNVLGRYSSFNNGETWLMVGGRRVLRFNGGIFDEMKALRKGFDPADYPLVASGEELDVLLAKEMPLNELRDLVADRRREDSERPVMQTKRLLVEGCVACVCPPFYHSKGVC